MKSALLTFSPMPYWFADVAILRPALSRASMFRYAQWSIGTSLKTVTWVSEEQEEP